MKVCKECGVKPRMNMRSLCTTCYYHRYHKGNTKVQEYKNKYRSNKAEGYYSVYLLPKEHYVGQTDNTWKRMCEHRHVGNDTTDYQILHKCTTREEALRLERSYHEKGYKG